MFFNTNISDLLNFCYFSVLIVPQNNCFAQEITVCVIIYNSSVSSFGVGETCTY